MYTKSLKHEFPGLFLAVTAAAIDTSTAGDTITNLVGDLSTQLTNITGDITVGADGSLNGNADRDSGAVSGTPHKIKAGKSYVAVCGSKSTTEGYPSPILIWGSNPGVRFIRWPLGVSNGGALYLGNGTIPPNNYGEDAGWVTASRYDFSNKKASHRRWVAFGSALDSEDHYTDGTSGLLTDGPGTAPDAEEALDMSILKFTIENQIFYGIYWFELDNYPSEEDLTACAEFMSSSKGVLWPGCANWS